MCFSARKSPWGRGGLYTKATRASTVVRVDPDHIDASRHPPASTSRVSGTPSLYGAHAVDVGACCPGVPKRTQAPVVETPASLLACTGRAHARCVRP